MHRYVYRDEKIKWQSSVQVTSFPSSESPALALIGAGTKCGCGSYWSIPNSSNMASKNSANPGSLFLKERSSGSIVYQHISQASKDKILATLNTPSQVQFHFSILCTIHFNKCSLQSRIFHSLLYYHALS